MDPIHLGNVGSMGIRHDVFLRIEPLANYHPLAPILCARHYGRDCMFGMGHRRGDSLRLILGAALDALVYREYLDPHFSTPKGNRLIPADVNERGGTGGSSGPCCTRAQATGVRPSGTFLRPIP
jgi:hypothetical protein